jgi:hypothetical protein
VQKSADAFDMNKYTSMDDSHPVRPNKESDSVRLLSDRIYEKPVRWLLGRQLLGALKGILLYTAYGDKLDPRDWMTGSEVSFDHEGKDEFWFDYLSDAGDGTKAMYSLAYLTLSRLWIKPGRKGVPSVNDKIITIKDDDGEDSFELPRGRFLFIGGDTSYHVADYMTLVNRFQRPFSYAYQDLRNRNLISDESPRRPVFGIPGNHDYYDQVDGFRRQFRKPVRPEGPAPPRVGSYKSTPQSAALTIAGFQRVQEASYVALRLPFDWWLWGLDTEPGLIDRRQKEFFVTRQLNAQDAATVETDEKKTVRHPKKLIVATCSPSTVFGRVANPADFKATRSMRALGLEVPFSPHTKKHPKPDLTTTGDEKLKEGECRLDLSGDVHHYARYWGPASGVRPREKNAAPQPTAKSYASVVSGAGGAFHHPSSTYDDEVCEQVLYPDEPTSRTAAGNTLFKFWNVMMGGYVWLAGLVIALTIYFCVTVPPSSRQFLSNIGVINALSIDKRKPETIKATVLHPDSEACVPVERFGLWTTLGMVSDKWQPPAGCTPSAPGYFFPDRANWPADLILGQIFIWTSVIAVLITFILAAFTDEIFDKTNPFEENTNPDKKLFPIICITVPLLVVGLLSVQPYRLHITPFVNSLIVLFCLFTGATAIILNVRYSEYLFKQSFVKRDVVGWAQRVKNKVDECLPWFLWLMAVVIVTFGLWFYGKNNLAAYLISDITFILILIAATAGILLLPFTVGADLLYTKPKWLRILGKTAIGVWHLLLQILVPYILIANGNYIMWILAAVLILLPILPAQWLLKNNKTIGLTVLWFIYGGVMLTLPWTTRAILPLFRVEEYRLVFSGLEGWMILIPSLAAGVVGAIVCCLWTGWYFAVCFAFNGHNNEVGGTARIEKFKEFIRFRLTPEGITGYVIAVEDPSKVGETNAEGRVQDGSDLEVKLIDIFHLEPKRAIASKSS